MSIVRRRVEGRERVTVSARVSNLGASASSGLFVELLLDGAAVDSEVVALDAGGSVSVAFDEVPRPQGSRAKILTITRDPRDVPYSMYRHLCALERGPFGGDPPSFHDYVTQRWMPLGLYPAYRAEYRHSTVQHTQGTFNFNGEIHVARRIYNIYSVLIVSLFHTAPETRSRC